MSLLFLVLLVVASSSALDSQWPPNAVVENGDTFEFIVVGAGSAGSVVAARLSEDPNTRVLLVEAGPDPPEASVDPNRVAELPFTKYDWNYTTVNDNYASQGLKNPGQMLYSVGKMLGGSSSLNDTLYVRGNKEDFNNWARDGFLGWDYESVLPYFMKSEGLQDDLLSTYPYAVYHNATGLIIVSQRSRQPITENGLNVYFQSYPQIGINVNNDYNGEDQYGVSKPYFTQSLNPPVRYSTAQAFLVPNKDRQNLFVLKDAVATRITFDANKRATGIEIYVNGTNIHVNAVNEVIVSAGVMGTPKILVASGIGPAEDLERLNISAVSILPVGENLQDHPIIPVAITGAPAGDTDVAIIDVFESRFITGFLPKEGSNVPGIQLVSMYCEGAQNYSAAYQLFDIYFQYQNETSLSIKELNEKYELFLVGFIPLHPLSKGYVKINSVDVDVNPEIHMNYFQNSSDVKTVVDAIKLVTKLTETEYLKSHGSFVPDITLPQCSETEFLSDEYWECYVKNLAYTIYHATGTCSMGKVVDNDLNVFGVSNLRIVDGSVIPEVPSGNTNAAIIMVAEKISDVIKTFYKSV